MFDVSRQQAAATLALVAGYVLFSLWLDGKRRVHALESIADSLSRARFEALPARKAPCGCGGGAASPTPHP